MLRASRTVVLLAAALAMGAATAQGRTASAETEARPQSAAQGIARASAIPNVAVTRVRETVEAHRARLEGEIAELTAILAAQGALMEYVESGGTGAGLDPRLCRALALRGLCAELTETFAERGR